MDSTPHVVCLSLLFVSFWLGLCGRQSPAARKNATLLPPRKLPAESRGGLGVELITLRHPVFLLGGNGSPGSKNLRPDS